MNDSKVKDVGTFSLHYASTFAVKSIITMKLQENFKMFGILLMGVLPFCLQGQSGILSGTIFDPEAGETIIGANVIIEELTIGAATDFDGMYIIRNIPAGKYTVKITSIGLETQIHEDVTFAEGEKKELSVSMNAATTLLNEVTVVEQRRTNTEAAVLQEIKSAKQVVSGVSKQQITKSQDGNAAQVMQRVPGVTIVENRFVMIRGLSERYNNVMINNVVAPSTEVDKRTFSFDLISSNSLDRMLIYKSGSADIPGDFAGGVIKLYTVDAVDKDFLNISVGVGGRLGTTGMPFYQSEGSSTDFLGFDNGYRKLPSDFPKRNAFQNSPRNSPLRKDAARSLPNNFNATESTAMPDYSVGVAYGKNINFKSGAVLSTINTINYSTSYLSYQRDFYRYFEWVDRTQPILKRFEYVDDNHQKENKISVLSDWTLKLNDKTRIKFKNLFNQIGENETIFRNGFDYIQRPNDDLKNYLLGYRSRSIYTGQLEGEHKLNGADKIVWVGGFSYLKESEPDLRRFRTYRPKDQSDLSFIMQLPPSSNLFETGRYFGSLDEYSINNGLDYYKKFAKGLFNAKETNLKVGYYVDYRSRNFSSRYFSYLYPGLGDPTILRELERLPLDRIFAPENFDTQNAFTIEEGTRPIDTYSATSFLSAGYASVELPFEKFNATLGLRTEFNLQTLDTQDDLNDIEVSNPITAVMPFLNLAYNISENSILRFAYGRTLNRPEFRELAPFLFYDYELEAARVGNPDLRTATIDNLDIRYEIYPRSGETIALGVFYKHFDSPIENRTIITTEQPNFTYINADYARNYGAEIEIRKSLKGVTNSGFLDRFSFNVNAALIFSSVDLGESAVAQDRVRALQGQSPYIINAAMYYEGVKGVNMSLVYNVFGSRIYSVGDVIFPTIYELSRNALDLTVSKKVTEKINIKFGIQDILNQPHRFFEDSDRNNKIDLKNDNPVFTFKRGQLISLGVTFDLI